MAKKSNHVGISKSTANKIQTVKNKVSSPFKEVTTQDIINAVFSRPADQIIDFVKAAKNVVAKNAKQIKKKTVRRIEPTRRKELIDTLLKNKKVVVKNVREATSLYNHFLLSRKGKVSYHQVRKGVVNVTWKP